MFRLIKSLIFLLLLTTATSQAGIWLEPYVGFQATALSGSASYTGFAGGAPISFEDSGYGGLALGSRIGYEYLGLIVGGEFYRGSGDDSDSTNSYDYEDTRLGIFAGYEFPFMLRVYGSYFFSSDTTIDYQALSGGGTGSYEFGGSGFKLGAGFTLLPLVSINLEYGMTSYDDGSLSVGSTTYAASSSSVEDNTFVISLSLPINI